MTQRSWVAEKPDYVQDAKDRYVRANVFTPYSFMKCILDRRGIDHLQRLHMCVSILVCICGNPQIVMPVRNSKVVM